MIKGWRLDPQWVMVNHSIQCERIERRAMRQQFDMLVYQLQIKHEELAAKIKETAGGNSRH